MKTHLLLISVIGLGLVSCMKKTSVGKLTENPKVVLPDYTNPATASPECPNGVMLSLMPSGSGATYRVNEQAQFLVTASGCKYGYRLSYDTDNKAFGMATDVPSTLFSTTFPKTFSSSGSAIVDARVIVLGAGGLPAREHRLVLSVVVAPPIALSCPPAEALISQSVSGDFSYSYSFQPNRPVVVNKVESSDPTFIVSSPTFSTVPSQSIQGNITVKPRTGTLSFEVQDANQLKTNCLVTLRKELFGVSQDFNGDRMIDDATLVRNADGSYQLQMSYTNYAGATKTNVMIPATGFLASEVYEWMAAGDLNADQRPDILFFRREGTPAVGKFKLARSKGGTVGGTDLSFDFVDLPGQWASDRLLPLTDIWVRTGLSSPFVIGSFDGKQYVAKILNGVMQNLEKVTASASITAASNPVSAGGSTQATLTIAGYGQCRFTSCDVNVCTEDGSSESLIESLDVGYQSVTRIFNIGPVLSARNLRVRCEDNAKVAELLLQVTSSPPPPPPLPVPTSTQVIYRMSDFRLNNNNVSTWGNMAYYYTQNPSEAGTFFKDPLQEFYTFTSSPGPECNVQLYKCSYFKSADDARQFLSLDRGCNGNFPNGAATNPSIGFVCTSQRAGTARLYEWYRAASQGRIYSTDASNALLTNLGFVRSQTAPVIYVPTSAQGSAPSCVFAAFRRGKTELCDLTVTSTGGPIAISSSPLITGSSATGTWNSAGNIWTGTSPCSASVATNLSASVSGLSGNTTCSPASVAIPPLSQWVATSGQACSSVCGGVGMTSVPYTDGNYCASGEVRPAGVTSISYSLGTWGSGTEFINGQSVGQFCYGSNSSKSQKRDNDKTDKTVACYCSW